MHVHNPEHTRNETNRPLSDALQYLVSVQAVVVEHVASQSLHLAQRPAVEAVKEGLLVTCVVAVLVAIWLVPLPCA